MANFSSPGMGTYGSTWQHGGYSGCGNVGELLGSLTGRPALICGNAASVFEDYAKALQRYPEAIVYGVNDVGMYLPRMHHWVTGHGDNALAWKTVRWLEDRSRREYMQTDRVWIHSVMDRSAVDYVWDQLNPQFALSGNLAMQIAWLMGCAPIILCGCPNSPKRRFFDVTSRDTFGYGGGQEQADRNIRQQIEIEMGRVPAFKAVVRSMSGWSKEFFGGIEREVNHGSLCDICGR
jgi:hypothetical protein